MINWRQFEDNIIEFYDSVDSSRTMFSSAQRIATIFQQSMMEAETMFGQKVLSINVKPFEISLFSAFAMQYASPILLGILPYQIIAYGLLTSLLTIQISGYPMIPPTISPLPPKPNIVLFPGQPQYLALMLKFAMADFVQIKTTKMSAKLLTLALRLHLTTVSGIYLGMLPSINGLIPAPPIPWVGIF